LKVPFIGERIYHLHFEEKAVRLMDHTPYFAEGWSTVGSGNRAVSKFPKGEPERGRKKANVSQQRKRPEEGTPRTVRSVGFGKDGSRVKKIRSATRLRLCHARPTAHSHHQRGQQLRRLNAGEETEQTR